MGMSECAFLLTSKLLTARALSTKMELFLALTFLCTTASTVKDIEMWMDKFCRRCLCTADSGLCQAKYTKVKGHKKGLSIFVQLDLS